MFLLVLYCFFRRRKQIAYSVSSVFMFILTTDIQDFTDANHERKRVYP